MDINIDKQTNELLDEVIKSRRSVRSFKKQSPPKENIEDILNAGMLAPFAAQAVGEIKDFRRFFVFENDTPSIEIAEKLMKNKAVEGLNHFKSILKEKPFLKPRVQPFMDKLQMTVDNGVLGVGTAPYFIVVAEVRGIPPVEQESIAHCLENMWLKATALKLGFHLVSLTSQMAEDKEFLTLLNIPAGKYSINGCAVGYPAIGTPSVNRPEVKDVTIWMGDK